MIQNGDMHVLFVFYSLGIFCTAWAISKKFFYKQTLTERQTYMVFDMLQGGVGFLFLGLIYSFFLYMEYKGGFFLTRNRFMYIFALLMSTYGIVSGRYGMIHKKQIKNKMSYFFSQQMFWSGILVLVTTLFFLWHLGW